MINKLNTNENGYTRENELLINLNKELIKFVVNDNENNLFKLVNWLNKSNEHNNKYGFTVFNVILDLNNTNDFKTFNDYCINNVNDFKIFEQKTNNMDLNNCIVYVFENNFEYFVIDKNDMVQFIIDYILYDYYNNFLCDLYKFLSDLI